MTSTVQKWGNSLGVRIPKSVADGAKITQGAQVTLVVENGCVVMRPVETEVPSLEQLLSKVKKGSRPPVDDWGKPVGKEVW